MKTRRMLSALLTLVLIVSLLLPVGVHAAANELFIPFSTVFHATVIKGETITLSFVRRSNTDVYVIEIYKGSAEDLSNAEDPVPVETREYSSNNFDSSDFLYMSWTADSRYSAGDYTLICYCYYSSTGYVPDQLIYAVPLHVVAAPRPANDVLLTMLTSSDDFALFMECPEAIPYDEELVLVPMLLPYANTSDRRFTITGYNKKVLSVSQSWSAYHGYIRIRGNRVGSTDLTVDYGSIKKTFHINVDMDGFRIEMQPKQATLCPGQTDTLTPKYDRDTPDKTWTLNGDEFVAPLWKSENPEIATVKNGVVTAVSPGTATIKLIAGSTVKAVQYTVRPHQFDASQPVVPKTATQPAYQDGHCSICGQDGVRNIVEPAIFTDTKASAWYAKHVDKVYDLGLMNGVGEHTFAPNASVTRAMAATVLYRIAGKPKVEGASTFTDVAPGKYYSKAVVWAQETGVVNGYPDGTFRPDENITREQLAAILCRYARATGCDVSAATDLGSFPDGEKVHSYAKKALAWAVAEKLITGVGVDGKTFLQPTNNATRAQFATIISRYLSTIQPAPEEPDNPPQPEDQV